MLTLIAAMMIAPRWELTFEQNFDGPSGQAPDPKVWTRDLGADGWGNAEWQEYTDGNRNAFLDGKGNLVIEARKEAGEKKFTSARLNTRGKFTQAYGRFEARLKMPVGKGIWPAFWMLGDNDMEVGWPGCGEIDIMEYLGHQPKTVHGTVHGPGYSGAGGIGKSADSATPLNEGFHVYAIEWEPERIRWFFDDKVYHTLTPDDLGAREWVFDHAHFLILNLAVGGGWPGYPDETTAFPQRYLVDYVRVYKDANLVVDAEGIAKRRAERLRKHTDFKGAPVVALPGTVHAVDYAEGRYKDLDRFNQGGLYRPADGVDISLSGLESPKYSVGWIGAGEWLGYRVKVAKAARHTVEFEVASGGEGGFFHLEIEGKDATGPIKVPDTGGWNKWKAVRKEGVEFPAGSYEIKVVFDKDGETGGVGNFSLLRVK
ncbi:MAG TPA: family 16 glycosylhydrolase [Fimbriimonas sp.]